MHWLFLLMAVGALFVGFTVTSTPLMVVSLLASLALFVVWIMGWYARRVGESSQDPSMMIDPAELRRLREIAEARRANAVPPSEPPAP
ncbi:hypothetical protein MUU77_00525 [Pseudoxanthomonas sp. F37]|uniref:hypothetical protein n=1 Tax=Pseudoxanthomonas TaxID=83618 RepID=UPI001FD2F924|nr:MULTISPECIES: hypothetical protein [Pseudoxanthomonas]UOV06959.1 hypothetical protein MUU75_11765 [Pseudoxanthomonas mexicana]UOV10424.1 hypothetical protein MUU77_00525 [Pseudoxanthomonas sp. F37]